MSQSDDLRVVGPQETARRVDAEVCAAHRHFRKLVNHNGDYGALLEGILRDAIRPRLRDGLCVGTGYIRSLNRASPQTDIIIYDRRRYPELFSQGQVSLVRDTATIAVGEVKSNIRKDCEEAIKSLAWHKDASPRIVTFAFGFAGWKSLEGPRGFKARLHATVLKNRLSLFNLSRSSFFGPDLIVNGKAGCAVKQRVVGEEVSNAGDTGSTSHRIISDKVALAH